MGPRTPRAACLHAFVAALVYVVRALQCRYVNIDGKLKELLPNEQVDSTVVKAVAVVGKDNETFVGIARMMPMQFVQHATGMGGFGIFLTNEGAAAAGGGAPAE